MQANSLSLFLSLSLMKIVSNEMDRQSPPAPLISRRVYNLLTFWKGSKSLHTLHFLVFLYYYPDPANVRWLGKLFSRLDLSRSENSKPAELV